MSAERIRILRIIARLNVGGTAVHVTLLTQHLDHSRFETILISGTENPGEGTMIDFARAHGVDPVVVSEMVGQATLAPRDVIALWKLVRMMRKYRPHIVDTHTAKAGSLGRFAAWLAGVPVIVHTYHGHVLEGYYDPLRTSLLRLMERGLAAITTRVVAVSEGVGNDLVRLRAIPAEKLEVIPLGMELDEFAAAAHHAGAIRREFGIPSDAPVIGIVGRLFPIKNHALFLEAAARVRSRVPAARFLIVGDGTLRESLERQAAALDLGAHAIFTGWRRDLPELYADMSLLVVSSNNEGTPFSAIEAMAAGVPVVATRVGGLPDVIRHDLTGVLVPPRDAEALAAAIVGLLQNDDRRHRLAAAARVETLTRYAVERLARDTAELYERLLRERGVI